MLQSRALWTLDSGPIVREIPPSPSSPLHLSGDRKEGKSEVGRVSPPSSSFLLFPSAAFFVLWREREREASLHREERGQRGFWKGCRREERRVGRSDGPPAIAPPFDVSSDGSGIICRRRCPLQSICTHFNPKCAEISRPDFSIVSSSSFNLCECLRFQYFFWYRTCCVP